jgi:hypothetical protein
MGRNAPPHRTGVEGREGFLRRVPFLAGAETALNLSRRSVTAEERDAVFDWRS